MKEVIVLIGNYGSGKTELALNFAFRAAREGKKVELIDLDMVNKAIVNAEKLLDQSERTPVGCHLHNPSTTIHVLVSELMNIR